jgi:hypothetical protein
MDGSGSSSSPGLLIPTPLHSDAGPRGGTTGFGLRDWSRGLLPTPKTTDAHHSSPADPNRNAPGLRAVSGLLRTPTAQLAMNGGSQHPDKQKAGGHGPTLADEIEHLLPTPTAMDSKKASGGSTPSDVTLTDAVVPTAMGAAENPRHGALLPTPKVAASRTSRGAMTRDGQWSAPGLEQAIEMAQRILPREFQSWDEVPGWHGGLIPMPSDDGNTA